MTSADFVPLAARRRGLVLRTYQVDADGRRHGYSPVVVVVPEPVPPMAELWLDLWPDCRCPHHRADCSARQPTPGSAPATSAGAP